MVPPSCLQAYERVLLHGGSRQEEERIKLRAFASRTARAARLAARQGTVLRSARDGASNDMKAMCESWLRQQEAAHRAAAAAAKAEAAAGATERAQGRETAAEAVSAPSATAVAGGARDKSSACTRSAASATSGAASSRGDASRGSNSPHSVEVV